MRNQQDQQQGLPFAEAEASAAERRTTLGLALMKVRCDLQLREFCMWVFNVTGGGLAGSLVKSHKQLADAPWGLCCSVSKVRTVVGRAQQLGLVRVDERYSDSGASLAKGYQIDWPGIQRLLRPAERSSSPRTVDAGGVSTRQGAASPEQPPVLSKQAYKEHSSFPPLTIQKPPPPSSSTVATWQQVAEAAAAVLDDWANAVSAARRHGCDPAHVLALIQEFTRRVAERPGSWGTGALHLRLCQAHPSKPISDGWPPPKRGARQTRAEPTLEERRHEQRRREAKRVSLAARRGWQHPDAATMTILQRAELIEAAVDEALAAAGLSEFSTSQEQAT